MTDQTPTAPVAAPESAVQPPADAAATDSGQADDTPVDDGQEAPSADREAAKYRRRLREVEKERDKLAEQVTGHHRAAVERLAAEQMSTPGDLWLAGVDLADLIGDEGDVDDDKVADAVDQVLADRPHWRKASPPAFDGGARQSAPVESSWAEVLRGSNRTRRA